MRRNEILAQALEECGPEERPQVRTLDEKRGNWKVGKGKETEPEHTSKAQKLHSPHTSKISKRARVPTEYYDPKTRSYKAGHTTQTLSTKTVKRKRKDEDIQARMDEILDMIPGADTAKKVVGAATKTVGTAVKVARKTVAAPVKMAGSAMGMTPGGMAAKKVGKAIAGESVEERMTNLIDMVEAQKVKEDPREKMLRRFGAVTQRGQAVGKSPSRAASAKMTMLRKAAQAQRKLKK
jgi:hypothetical protein